MIGVLLKAGADLKARGNFGGTPLHRAVSNRNLSVMRALLEAGADPNATERTPSAKSKGGARPLHKAAYREDPAFVTALIEAGAHPNSRDSFGNTPLHNAIGNKNPATVAALLKGGGDPNARGQLGKTPLDRAIEARNRAVAELLLKAGDTATAAGGTGTGPSARAKSRDSAAPGAGASRSTRVASSWTGKCESWPSAGWFRDATPAMVRKCLRAGAHPNHWDNTGYPIEVGGACKGTSFKANYPYKGTYSPFESMGLTTLRPGRWYPAVSAEGCHKKGRTVRFIACRKPFRPYFTSPNGSGYACFE